VSTLLLNLDPKIPVFSRDSRPAATVRSSAQEDHVADGCNQRIDHGDLEAKSPLGRALSEVILQLLSASWSAGVTSLHF
jgi:hypothetical protein